MSDIARFTIWDCVYTPASSGEWVRYDDHRAEVERLMADVVKLRIELNSAQVEASQRWGEVERLKNAIDRVMSERDAALAEVERLTARQTEMETHITGLTTELHRTRADGIELRWVVDEVEQLTAQRDAAQANVERLKNAIDHLTSERNEAQAEVERLTQERDEARAERDLAQGERERLQDLLRCERQELSTLRERLRQPRSDQSAQNLDMANGQAILDSSRPDDETIWREAFMSAVHDVHKNWMDVADVALAQYRKRWPR